MMKFDGSFVSDVMYLFDTRKEPLYRIAYIMNCDESVVEDIVMAEISKSVVEVC
jgi:hypothetical protein